MKHPYVSLPHSLLILLLQPHNTPLHLTQPQTKTKDPPTRIANSSPHRASTALHHHIASPTPNDTFHKLRTAPRCVELTPGRHRSAVVNSDLIQRESFHILQSWVLPVESRNLSRWSCFGIEAALWTGQMARCRPVFFWCQQTQT